MDKGVLDDRTRDPDMGDILKEHNFCARKLPLQVNYLHHTRSFIHPMKNEA